MRRAISLLGMRMIAVFAWFVSALMVGAEPQRPAVLFAGLDGGSCGCEIANGLVQAVFGLRADHASLSERPLTWNQIRQSPARQSFIDRR